MGKVARVPSIIDDSKKKMALRNKEKQKKMALKLSIKDMKRRAKGMICAAGLPDMMTASVCPKENTMSGEINSVKLTGRLRKKLGYAELLMVDENHEENLENHMKPGSCLPYYYGHPAKKAQDRLLQWRLNHTQKDGSLSSEEAKQKWKLACQILAKKGLIPEDENIEENERVYTAVMESEHPDSMLCKDFGMTFRKKFSDNAPNFDGAESSNNNKAELARLAEEMSEQSQEIQSLKNTTNQLVAVLQQQCQISQAFLPSTTDVVVALSSLHKEKYVQYPLRSEN